MPQLLHRSVETLFFVDAHATARGRLALRFGQRVIEKQVAGGAAALLSNPAANVVDALAPAYEGNRARAAEAIRVNGGSTDMTAGQFAQKWIDKYEGGSPGTVAPPVGAVTKSVQQMFVRQAESAWPDFKRKIDAGATRAIPVFPRRDLRIHEEGALGKVYFWIWLFKMQARWNLSVFER